MLHTETGGQCSRAAMGQSHLLHRANDGEVQCRNILRFKGLRWSKRLRMGFPSSRHSVCCYHRSARHYHREVPHISTSMPRRPRR